MKTLYKKLVSLVRDEQGTETVEWALVAGLLVILAAGGYSLVSGDITTIMTHNSLVDGYREKLAPGREGCQWTAALPPAVKVRMESFRPPGL